MARNMLHHGAQIRPSPVRPEFIQPEILEVRFMTPADVLKLIKEKGIRFVDYRFADTRGKEQHVTVPASTVEAEVFESGKMFDGSSIAGWKGINESDMILMPEAASAVIDPF